MRKPSGGKASAVSKSKKLPVDRKLSRTPEKSNSASEEAGSLSTEMQILSAARQVFHRNGLAGARMQEIAEEAGLNQALLHYYFRSKENLFAAVFKEDLQRMLDRQSRELESGGELFDLIRRFVRGQIGFLQEHPYLPQFIFQELKRCPSHVQDDMAGHRKKLLYAGFRKKIQEAARRGVIRQIHPVDLITNLMALCSHPFLAKPMIMMNHGFSEADFDRFIEQRKTSVAEFVICSLRCMEPAQCQEASQGVEPRKSSAKKRV